MAAQQNATYGRHSDGTGDGSMPGAVHGSIADATYGRHSDGTGDGTIDPVKTGTHGRGCGVARYRAICSDEFIPRGLKEQMEYIRLRLACTAWWHSGIRSHVQVTRAPGQASSEQG